MGKVTLLSHLKSCAEAAKNFANGLVAGVAQAATEALEEMEKVKADKPKAISVTIPITGWSEGSGDYPHYYDIPASEITADDRVIIAIDPDSEAVAIACGMCSTCISSEGAVRIKAMEVPASAIQAEYWIDKGRGE